MQNPNFQQTVASKGQLKEALENLKKDFLRRYPDQALTHNVTIRVIVGEHHESAPYHFVPGRLREAWLAQVAHVIDTIKEEIADAKFEYPLRVALDVMVHPPGFEATT